MPRLRFLALPALALGGAALLFSLLDPAPAGPRLLHSEPSLFGSLLVFEDDGQRCMNFNTMVDVGRQTCMDLDDPERLVFGYTRMMVGSLLFRPGPESILIVGLGGATLQKTLAKLLPDATIDTVEIDPAVGTVAERYFGYRQGPKQRLFVEDGRAYIERAHREGRQYDVVMLDAFDVDYIPRHLMTVEFLEHVKGILAPDGIVVANTFTKSRLHERETATYLAVFGPFYSLRGANRVIVAGRGELPGPETLANQVQRFREPFEALGIDGEYVLQRFGRVARPAGGAELLRDESSGD